MKCKHLLVGVCTYCQWHRTVVGYPAGAMVSPDNVMHPGPVAMAFENAVTGRWEFDTNRYGKWSFVILREYK